MKSGLVKLAGGLAGALMLAGVVVPSSASAAAPGVTSVTINQTGCDANAVANNGGPFTGTVVTSTSRGVTTTKTTYSGEITTTVIVPVGKSPATAKFMVSDEAGNEYFATTHAKAFAAAMAFNRANRGRYISKNGVPYYAHTRKLAQEAAMNAAATGYVNGVPVSNTPQFLATSKNGTAFWSNCSQARANALAARDLNRARKVWHATNASTGQVMTSAVSAKFANELAAYHYVGYTNGELAAYGFNCQVLTAMSYAGIITAFQAQMAALPYSSYGGDFVGYDVSGTNPADMQMFRGATQAQANAAAAAFGKSLVKGGVFVVDNNGLCATVGSSISQVMAIQNREPTVFTMNSSSIGAGPAGLMPTLTVNVPTGLKAAVNAWTNVAGKTVRFISYVDSSSSSAAYPDFANGTYDATWNMAYYDQGYINGTINPPPPTPALTVPFMARHATLPTTSITCVPYSFSLAGAPSTWTGISYNCPSYYHLGTTP